MTPIHLFFCISNSSPNLLKLFLKAKKSFAPANTVEETMLAGTKDFTPRYHPFYGVCHHLPDLTIRSRVTAGRRKDLLMLRSFCSGVNIPYLLIAGFSPSPALFE